MVKYKDHQATQQQNRGFALCDLCKMARSTGYHAGCGIIASLKMLGGSTPRRIVERDGLTSTTHAHNMSVDCEVPADYPIRGRGGRHLQRRHLLPDRMKFTRTFSEGRREILR